MPFINEHDLYSSRTAIVDDFLNGANIKNISNKDKTTIENQLYDNLWILSRRLGANFPSGEDLNHMNKYIVNELITEYKKDNENWQLNVTHYEPEGIDAALDTLNGAEQKEQFILKQDSSFRKDFTYMRIILNSIWLIHIKKMPVDVFVSNAQETPTTQELLKALVPEFSDIASTIQLGFQSNDTQNKVQPTTSRNLLTIVGNFAQTYISKSDEISKAKTMAKASIYSGLEDIKEDRHIKEDHDIKEDHHIKQLKNTLNLLQTQYAKVLTERIEQLKKSTLSHVIHSHHFQNLVKVTVREILKFIDVEIKLKSNNYQLNPYDGEELLDPLRKSALHTLNILKVDIGNTLQNDHETFAIYDNVFKSNRANEVCINDQGKFGTRRKQNSSLIYS